MLKPRRSVRQKILKQCSLIAAVFASMISPHPALAQQSPEPAASPGIVSTRINSRGYVDVSPRLQTQTGMGAALHLGQVFQVRTEDRTLRQEQDTDLSPVPRRNREGDAIRGLRVDLTAAMGPGSDGSPDLTVAQGSVRHFWGRDFTPIEDSLRPQPVLGQGPVLLSRQTFVGVSGDRGTAVGRLWSVSGEFGASERVQLLRLDSRSQLELFYALAGRAGAVATGEGVLPYLTVRLEGELAYCLSIPGSRRDMICADAALAVEAGLIQLTHQLDIHGGYRRQLGVISDETGRGPAEFRAEMGAGESTRTDLTGSGAEFHADFLRVGVGY